VVLINIYNMFIFEILKNYFSKKVFKNKDIEYWLNDPSLNIKGFYKNIQPAKSFKVNGYSGGGFELNSYKGRAANCYAVTHKLLSFFEEKGFEIPSWPEIETLNIYPMAGMDLNAYYDRKSIRFFYYFDYKLIKNIYLCESSDVVSHETGHAILDAIRPDFWNVQSYEIWALHESFGDISAILNILDNEEILKLIIKETNGNLSSSNSVSRLAEHFAKTVYNVTNGKFGSNPNFLRDAVNNYSYLDPINLPDEAEDNKLSRECHSFSRVWTGCWYDIFVGIYNLERKNHENKRAIKIARDISAKYFMQSILESPCTFNIFDALSQKMLQVDARSGGKYSSLMKSVFEKRNTLKKYSIQTLNNFKENKEKTKKIQITGKKINKNLLNCFMEIPIENRYEKNSSGELTFLSFSNEEESIDQAISCLNYLLETQNFKKLFKIKNKNIVRSKFIN
jgi:hypothetical protein